MTRPLRPSRALAKARAAIERYGWVQGRFGSKRDGFCVAGAIDHVAGHPDGMDVTSIFRLVTGEDTYTNLGEWNDARGRTKRDVIAKFDQAIVLAESLEASEAAVPR